MLKSFYYIFVPKQLSCRYTHRYKDYKVIWKKQGILEDWQNLANRSATLTEQWQSEKNEITDISRLPKFLKNRKSDILEVSKPRERYETGVDYQRTTYSRFGKASKLDPGEICWASPEEIELLNDREKNYEDKFVDLMNTLKEESNKKQAAIDEFQNRVRENLKNLPSMISDYENRQNKALTDAEKRVKNRSNLLREAREYYGFSIGFNDPRMDKFREIKGSEQKNQALQSKKKRKV